VVRLGQYNVRIHGTKTRLGSDSPGPSSGMIEHETGKDRA